MTFIPNEADAFDTIQAEFDPQDFVMITHAIKGNGVLSGCACSEDAGGPSLDIDIAVGSINLNHDTVEVTAGSVTLDAADVSNPRIDLVVITSAGAKTFRKGTAAATPVMPALSADDTCLCALWVPASDTQITDSQISDKRIFVRGFVAIRKSADESVSSSTTVQDDDELKFHMAANEVWAFRLQTFVSNDGTSGADIKWNYGLPSGAVVERGMSMPLETGSSTNDMKCHADYDQGTFSFGQPDIASAAFNTKNYCGQMWGVVTNGGTAGDFVVKWAQNASNANATNLHEGSVLMAWKLS